MPEEFPEHLRKFIEAHISSVEGLEVLLLLRQDPATNWTAEAMGQAIYTPGSAAAKRLAELADCSLAIRDPPSNSFRYQPASDELRQLVDELATIYGERRVAVISLIYSKPNDHVQAFADAFKLRKDKG